MEGRYPVEEAMGNVDEDIHLMPQSTGSLDL